MADKFSKALLRISLAQISKNVGFSLATVSSLDVLQDLLVHYIQCLNEKTHVYMEHAGRTQPILNDLSLAFISMGVSMKEIMDYMEQAGPVEFPSKVPHYPVPKPSRLNVPKSDHPELKTRPDYIPHFLPLLKPEETKSTELGVSSHQSRDQSFGLSVKNSTRKSGASKADDFLVGDWFNGDALFDFDAFTAGLVKTVHIADIQPPAMPAPSFDVVRASATIVRDVRTSLASTSNGGSSLNGDAFRRTSTSASSASTAASFFDGKAPCGYPSTVSSASSTKTGVVSPTPQSSKLKKNQRQLAKRFSYGFNEKPTPPSTVSTKPPKIIGPLKINIAPPPNCPSPEPQPNLAASPKVDPPQSFGKVASNDSSFSIDECISRVIGKTHSAPVSVEQSTTASVDFFERITGPRPRDSSNDPERRLDFIESVVDKVCSQSASNSSTSKSQESANKTLDHFRRQLPDRNAVNEKAEALVKTLKLTFPTLSRVPNANNVDKSAQGKFQANSPALPVVKIEETSNSFRSLDASEDKPNDKPVLSIKTNFDSDFTKNRSSDQKTPSQLSSRSIPPGRPSSALIGDKSVRGFRKTAPPRKSTFDSSTLFQPDAPTVAKRVAPLVLPRPKVHPAPAAASQPAGQKNRVAAARKERAVGVEAPANHSVGRVEKPLMDLTGTDGSAVPSLTHKLGPLKIKLQFPLGAGKMDKMGVQAPAKPAKRGRPPSAGRGGTLKKLFKFDHSDSLHKSPLKLSIGENDHKSQDLHQLAASTPVQILKIPKLILKLGPKPSEDPVAPPTRQQATPPVHQTPPTSASSHDSSKSTRFRWSSKRGPDNNFDRTSIGQSASSPLRVATLAPSTSFSPPPPTPSPRSVGSATPPPVAQRGVLFDERSAALSLRGHGPFVATLSEVNEAGHGVMGDVQGPEENSNQDEFIDEHIEWPEETDEPTMTSIAAPSFDSSTGSLKEICDEKIDDDADDKIWYCPICQVPYEDGVDMIACDKCDNWFHWTCVGLSRAPPDHEHWYCIECDKSSKIKKKYKT